MKIKVILLVFSTIVGAGMMIFAFVISSHLTILPSSFVSSFSMNQDIDIGGGQLAGVSMIIGMLFLLPIYAFIEGKMNNKSSAA